MAQGSTQPLTEMSTRDLPGVGSLEVLQPYGQSQPVTGIALPLREPLTVSDVQKHDYR
jgi:hypothetical protein